MLGDDQRGGSATFSNPIARSRNVESRLMETTVLCSRRLVNRKRAEPDVNHSRQPAALVASARQTSQWSSGPRAHREFGSSSQAAAGAPASGPGNDWLDPAA